MNWLHVNDKGGYSGHTYAHPYNLISAFLFAFLKV